ncbi:MAG: HAD family hydrolase [Alphaproteobacteria bacterium]|nr:HAD family hydrolase [Alphaproteobacteria bacterium]
MTRFYSLADPIIFPHHIKGVAFDNDNTLYVEPKNSKGIHKLAAFHAVQQYLPHLDEPEFTQLMVESRKKYGGSLEIFTKEHGIDPYKLRGAHYENLIKSAKEIDFFDPNLSPIDELDELRESKIPMVIATHGNMEWTLFSGRQTSLSNHFNEKSIVTKDLVGINKTAGSNMYEVVLDKFGAPITEKPEERGIGYAMIEDTAKNLEYAKKLGMTTILIDPQIESDDHIPDYVDIVVPDNRIAISCLLTSNALRRAKASDNTMKDTDECDYDKAEIV